MKSSSTCRTFKSGISADEFKVMRENKKAFDFAPPSPDMKPDGN